MIIDGKSIKDFIQMKYLNMDMTIHIIFIILEIIKIDILLYNIHRNSLHFMNNYFFNKFISDYSSVDYK